MAIPAGEAEWPGPARGSRAWWWDRYWRHLTEEAYRSRRTLDSYRKILWAFWASLGDRPPSRATARDLRRFLDRRVPPGGNSRGPRLSATSRRTYAQDIRRFYRWAYAAGLLTADPLRAVHVPPASLPAPRAPYLADVRTLLASVHHDPRLRLMAWLAYGCGLRASEIAGLRVEDVEDLDLANRRARVRSTGVRTGSLILTLSA